MITQPSQDLFYDLCFDPQFVWDEEVLLKKYPKDLIAHWAGLSETRRMIYRKLVFENVFDVISFVFNETFAVLGDEVARCAVRDFLHASSISSRHYYDIPRNAYAFWQETNFFQNADKPFLLELADFEFHRWELYQQQESMVAIENQSEVSLEEAKVILNPNLYLKNYSYAVHEIKSDESLESLEKHPVPLVLFRHPDTTEVEVFRLNSFSFEFLQTLQQNLDQTLGEIFEMYMSRVETEDSQKLLQDLLQFLKVLLEKKIILALGR